MGKTGTILARRGAKQSVDTSFWRDWCYLGPPGRQIVCSEVLLWQKLVLFWFAGAPNSL